MTRSRRRKRGQKPTFETREEGVTAFFDRLKRSTLFFDLLHHVPDMPDDRYHTVNESQVGVILSEEELGAQTPPDAETLKGYLIKLNARSHSAGLQVRIQRIQYPRGRIDEGTFIGQPMTLKEFAKEAERLPELSYEKLMAKLDGSLKERLPQVQKLRPREYSRGGLDDKLRSWRGKKTG